MKLSTLGVNSPSYLEMVSDFMMQCLFVFFLNSNNIHNNYYNIILRYLLRSELSGLFAYDLNF